MAAKRNPGKGLLAKALGAADRSGVHPVVSATQFSAHTRDFGGASMNAHTGHVLSVGTDTGYAVGGATNSFTGGRIRTQTEPIRSGQADLPPDVVLAHRRRIARTAPDDPNRLLGSWDARGSEANPRHEIDIDAADHMQHRKLAIKHGTDRGEDAIFGLEHGEDIRTKF